MYAPSKRWVVWLTVTLASFVALEAHALREPLTDEKPSETLTAALRYWLGVQPTHRRRWVASALFAGFWAGSASTYSRASAPTTYRDGRRLMKFPQGLQAENPTSGKCTLKVGDHDLSDLPIALPGPIVENKTPGDPNPLYVVWVPVMFEGPIVDPNGALRIVHEGEAEAIGLPAS